MPRVRTPRSDAGQVHLLGSALKTATGDSAENRSYLPAALLTQISGFLSDSQQNGVTLPGHTSLVARRAALEGKVTQETAEALTAEDALDTHIRDYIVVLARRCFRMKHSAAVLDFHQIDHAGTARPRATELAQEVIDELRHATRKLESGTARDIMRSYCITFETLEGESPEPGDVPATPAAPAGS